MDKVELNRIRTMLTERRERVHEAVVLQGAGSQLINLLKEVDSALERITEGTYGICVVCRDPIEDDRLLINPLINVCLDHLDEKQRRSLETDLDLANKMQRSMLPKNNIKTSGWEIFFYYEPAGVVSGDYCDIIESGDYKYFILGDVSGKGIAASMLMTHLHAMFHSMVPLDLGTAELVQRANRLMCESTSPELYATLLCIKADNNGRLEICNAGHPQPVVVIKNKIVKPVANGIPIGLFCDSEYSVTNVNLEKNDTLFLYTDGLTESFHNEEEFGIDRVSEFILENHHLTSKELNEGLLNKLKTFITGNDHKDDLTIMCVKKL